MNLWELPFEERRDLIIPKWIENLRSGNYKQGKFQLCHKDRYCCLGVLCETILEFDRNFFEIEHRHESKIFDDSLAFLPERAKMLLGMSEEGSTFQQNGRALTYMNDHQHKTFKEIADYIEQNVDRICDRDRAEYLNGRR